MSLCLLTLFLQRVGEEIWTEGEVDNAWEFEDSRTLEDAVFSA